MVIWQASKKVLVCVCVYTCDTSTAVTAVPEVLSWPTPGGMEELHSRAHGSESVGHASALLCMCGQCS